MKKDNLLVLIIASIANLFSMYIGYKLTQAGIAWGIAVGAFTIVFMTMLGLMLYTETVEYVGGIKYPNIEAEGQQLTLLYDNRQIARNNVLNRKDLIDGLYEEKKYLTASDSKKIDEDLRKEILLLKGETEIYKGLVEQTHCAEIKFLKDIKNLNPQLNKMFKDKYIIKSLEGLESEN